MFSKTKGTLITLFLLSATALATPVPSANARSTAMSGPTASAVARLLRGDSSNKFATDGTQAPADNGSLLTKTFSAMHSAINRLQDKYRTSNASAGSDKEIRIQLDDISTIVHRLQQRMKGASPASETYRVALQLDADLLTRCVTQHRGAALLRFLVEVRSSLELKLKFANASKGTSIALIQLIVKTVRGGNEVNDYEVWYVARGWSDVVEKYRRFDDLSSPAIMDLSAGNYLIWVKLAGREITERAPVTLGDDGKSKRRVTLAVP